MPEQTLTERLRAVRSKKSLGKILGLTVGQLSELLENLERGRCYRETTIPKKNGGVRAIAIPSRRLMAVQKIIGRAIAPISASPIAYCGVTGRSHVTGAGNHIGAKALANLDIQAFYPSISYRRVYRAMVDGVGVGHEVGRILTRLATRNGALPQGSPASPSIANLVMREFDDELAKMCIKTGCCPVRIMDDISISGEPQDVREMLDRTIGLVHRYGFRVRRDKTEVLSRGRGIVVAGLIVDKKVSVPKHTLRKGISRSIVRSRTRSILRGASEVSLRQLRRLNGQISYISACNPSFAKSKEVVRLRELLRSRETKEKQRREEAKTAENPSCCSKTPGDGAPPQIG